VNLAPQAFSPDHLGTRVSRTPRSEQIMRSMASPHFEIRRDQSISPEALRAEAPHTRLRLPVQSACSFTCSVEQTGNGLVRH